ncbi:unnamed protein product [Lepeophtheirus salmonis]|uniref:(salmon louse) hypothetical protein n=1 Tax=Lepeophtheirus salmonis TaxID=72036 RepID=A0A7R8D1W6_LEPSM|nr:unnamed protein product [Lepeophtheirus salmonis]CAF2972214.1 unnamed protein product [Lepeophtheirus salmonis]
MPSSRALFIFLYTSIVLGKGDDQRFLEEPQNIQTKIGDTVILPCRVENRRGKIQWTKGDFGLGIYRSLKDWPRYSMIEQVPDDWSLKIHPVKLEDDDNFQCQVLGSETSNAMRSRNSHLTVFVPPGNPLILGGPIKETLETSSLELECVSQGGKPAANIDWYDDRGNLLNDRATITYSSKRLSDDETSLKYKLYTSKSVLKFSPTLQNHNRSYRCEAWNEAGKAREPTYVTLDVKFSPNVVVMPIRAGVIREGDKVGFRCTVSANPPPHEKSYRWYIENEPIRSHFGFYYEIYNVSRHFNDKQIKCTVENDLGKAMGVRTMEVEYGPNIIQNPKTVAGDREEVVTLHCIVDSNPPSQYHWTKDDSREIISKSQNLTLRLSDATAGDSSSPKGKKPVLRSKTLQTGSIGQDAHINCEAHSVPEPNVVVWRYHGKILNEENPHYRIVNSPMQRGVRSTLIVRGTVDSDYGPYKCQVQNSYGRAELLIELEREQPFPLLVMVITIFAGVILVLTVVIVVILCRKRLFCCCNLPHTKSSPEKYFNNHMGTNNAEALEYNPCNTNILIRDKKSCENLDSPEADSACWDASDSQDGLYRIRSENGESLTTQMYRDGTELEPEFPPKPDVISTGYIRYGNYVRDFEPPQLRRDSLYSSGTSQSVLNISDPRFPATYSNTFHRQIPSGIKGPSQYSTFYPHPVTTLEKPRKKSLDKTNSFSSQQPLQLLDDGSINVDGVVSTTLQPTITNGANSQISLNNTNTSHTSDIQPHKFNQTSAGSMYHYPPLNTTTTSNGGLATHV